MPSTPPSPNDLTRQQLDELDTLLQRMLSLPLSAPPEPPLPQTPAPAPNYTSNSLPAGWRADPAAAPRPVLQTTAQVDDDELPQLAAMVAPLVADAATTSASARSSHAPASLPWSSVGFAGELPLPPSLRPFGPPTPDTGVMPSVGPYAPVTNEIPVGTGTLRGVDAPALPAGFQHPATSLRLAPEPEPIAETGTETEDIAELTPVPTEPETPPNPTTTIKKRGSRVPVPMWPVFAVNWILECLLGLLGPVGTAATHPAMKHLLGWSGLALLAGAGAWAARGMGWIELPF